MSVPDNSSASLTAQSAPEVCSGVDLPAEEESASAPSATPSKDSKCERLTFALPTNDEATTFRYAVVPLPKTYSDAVAAAIRVFGSVLINPAPEHIVLRQWIKNKTDEPVWAAVDPFELEAACNGQRPGGDFQELGDSGELCERKGLVVLWV